MLGLHCCVGFSLVVVSYSIVAVLRLLIAVAFLVVEHGLQGTGASIVASPWLEHRLNSCGAWA